VKISEIPNVQNEPKIDDQQKLTNVDEANDDHDKSHINELTENLNGKNIYL
jgi:hypothetical protein